MIRVLHTLGWVASGGVEQLRLVMAQNLSADEFEHHIICQEAFGPLRDQFEELGWGFDTIGLARHIFDPSWHRRAIAIARSFKPDIVHGAVYDGEALACSIGLALPRTKVVMEESSDPADRRWTGDLLMRAMLIRANVAVGESPAVGRYLTDRIRVSPKKVRVIDNAVAEPPTFSQDELGALSHSLGLAPGDLVIGSVGRLSDGHKRVSDLIRALAIVLDELPNARLLVVGDGPDRAFLQQLASELGVDHACVWAGYQPYPAIYYQLMDVFALASAWEAFGLVLVEAMWAKVPVIGSAVGGIPYVLDDGAAGVLVPDLDPSALAEAIRVLLQDPAERARLGASGNNRASTRFSAPRYASDIRDLYLTLTEPGSSELNRNQRFAIPGGRPEK